MARTPLAKRSKRPRRRSPTSETKTTRRRFLKGAGATVAGATLLGRLADPGHAKGSPPPGTRIVVVGAGLAGLTCAYRLQQAGYAAQIFEASGRIGGRCWTGRGDFADGQIYEHGGELIDSGHMEMKQLAQELGFSSTTSYTETNGTEQLGYFFGHAVHVRRR